MRRRKKSDTQSGRAINAFEHRAGRAFTVRAGDVDEAEFFLRIAGERGELARIFQPEIRAEHLQAVKKLDGFGIIHAPTAWQILKTFATFFSTPNFNASKVKFVKKIIKFLAIIF